MSHRHCPNCNRLMSGTGLLGRAEKQERWCSICDKEKVEEVN